MGKVLASFSNGFTGAVSRSVDQIVVSMGNASGGEIPFGAPVFLKTGENACLTFDPETSDAARFLGFAARAAVKAPDVYGSDEASFGPGDPVDVLVRGSIVLHFASAASPGSSVYIRKSDGALVGTAGGEGTTLQLPNVTVRTPSDSGHQAEVVLTKRNVM